MLLNANPKRNLIVLLLICLVVLSIPLFLRIKLDNSGFIGQESYHTYRLAEMINTNGITNYDQLSFSGKQLRYEYGMPFLISLLPNSLIWLFPILFGLSSLLLFYSILRRYDSDLALISSILLIFSPPFIYLFSVATKFSGAVFFILLGYYLYQNKNANNNYEYYSYFSFLIVSLFSAELTVLLVLFGLFLLYKNFIDFKKYLIFSILALIILLFEFKGLLIDVIILSLNYFNLDLAVLFSKLFFESSGLNGVSFFAFILLFIGVFYKYKEKYKYLLVYLIVLLLVLLTLYFNFLIYLFNFYLVLMASYGLIFLFDNEWKNSIFKTLTLIVVICGVIFSGVGYLHNISVLEPDFKMVEGINYLKSINNNAVVFSDVSNGVYLNYADKKNIADHNYLGVSDLDQRLKDMDTLFHAKKILEANRIINKYDIDYIFLDKQIIDSLYINDETELLFLLKYSPNVFYKQFDNGNVQIWEVFRSST